MCAKKHIKNKFIASVRKDGIVSISIKDANTTIDLTDFSEVYVFLSNLEKNIGLLILLDISNNPELNKQSRRFIYSSEMVKATKALAVFSANPMTNLLGNFLTSQSNGLYPMRNFSNENQASQWLLEYKKLPDDRLNAIVEMLNDLSELKFRHKINLSENNDIIDVVSFGLNMLSEEFEFVLNEKSKLQLENLSLKESVGSNNIHSHHLNQFARILIANSEEIIESVNTDKCALSNYNKEELIGKGLFDNAAENAQKLDLIRKTLKKGEPWRGDQQHKAKDGTYFWVDNNIIPINDDKFLIIQLDITTRKEAEKKLLFQIATAQSYQKERLGSAITKEITTTLSGLQYLLKSLDDKIKILSDKEMQMLITSVRKNFEHIIGNSKKLSSELNTPQLCDKGIISSVEGYVQEILVDLPHKISFKHHVIANHQLSHEFETLLYMLTVTICNYVIKNSDENTIKIQLDIANHVEIKISTTAGTTNVMEALNSAETEILNQLISYYNGNIIQEKAKTGITFLFPSSKV
ncbi:PAS domain S-box protein [Flavobacteriales bacterium]|nr:PAS domain S-box protein [Flavobacteriales bacterium]